VDRALQTPDLCLIQGLPGTGKSHVVAEIIRRATARGERVLLLAPSAPSIDRALDLVSGCDTIAALRAVGRQEVPDAAPPSSRALTFSEHLRFFHEYTLASARREVDRASDRLTRRRHQEASWPHLEELATRHDQLLAQLEGLPHRRSQVRPEIEAQAEKAESCSASPAGEEFAATFTRHLRARNLKFGDLDSRLAQVRRKVEELRAAREGLSRRRDALRPLVEAKEQGWWLTFAWWRATLSGKVLSEWAESEDRLPALDAELAAAEGLVGELVAEHNQLSGYFQAERSALIEAEVARREGVIRDEEEALRQELRLVVEKWQVASRGFDEVLLETSPSAPGDGGYRRDDRIGPLTLSLVEACPSPGCEAVAVARKAWQRQVQAERDHLAFARSWAEFLEQTADNLPQRLLECVNLVAGTIAEFQADEHFGENGSHRACFDLLLLEHAEQVTEADFFSVARRARRWVLVANSARSACGDSGDVRSPSADHRGTRTRRPRTGDSLGAASFFQRLWDRLHCDPRHLPYQWRKENGRLCCRLRPLPEGHEARLESERVADRPEIELRIASNPGGAPYLAEVVFPPAMSIFDAKAYIFRELGELPVNPLGQSLVWVEDSERVLLRLAESPIGNAIPVMIGQGVREVIGTLATGGDATDQEGVPWHTCCLEFDRQAGWHWENAETWAREHAGIHDLGRTVYLRTAHRMHPALARVLSDLLWGGADVAREGASAGERDRVVFVPVPPLVLPRGPGGGPARRGPPRGSKPALSHLPRSGAGLEIDLAERRGGDRLPPDLRSLLPSRGLVNYMEAVSVVRALEGLATAAPRPHVVAVVALYPAQADLLRLLIERSPTLRRNPLPVHVGEPDSLRELEFPVVLLSLTRSHSHRAVAFGVTEGGLELALTRARERVFLFGDMGTLVRRAQWDGPVDHLDPTAAARERNVVGCLVAYLHGQGRHASLFHLREGSATS
jgi:hypothetical protein